MEDTVPVAGGTGRIELNEKQAERVVGGGHYVTDSMGHRTWVCLVDDGYQLGDVDDWYDKAFLLEQMLLGGFSQDAIIAVAEAMFGTSPDDTAMAIKSGGPVYLAGCLSQNTVHGRHFG